MHNTLAESTRGASAENAPEDERHEQEAHRIVCEYLLRAAEILDERAEDAEIRKDLSKIIEDVRARHPDGLGPED